MHTHTHACTHILTPKAIELTTTIGEAFELAYKKFLEAKKAQEEFKKLKERLETASPQEKEEIKKQVEAIEARKAAELEKKRQAAERRAQEEAERIAKEAAERSYTPEDLTSIKVKGPPKYYHGECLLTSFHSKSPMDNANQTMHAYTCADVTEDIDFSGQDPEVAKQLAAVQREVEAIEVNSELERQSKVRRLYPNQCK